MAIQGKDIEIKYKNFAAAPAHYAQDVNWKNKGSGAAADRRTLVSPNRISINVNDRGYFLESQLELDLNESDTWDTTEGTDYTVAANRAGKDFYVYACQSANGITPIILISASSTFPSGYNADNSRKIGGFHCLCVAAGTIAEHPLTGYLAGDILPTTVWNLRHCPISSPEGLFFDDEINEWAMIYLPSGTGNNTASVFGGTISDNRNWMEFVDDGHTIKMRLAKDDEFQSLAAGSNEETNIRYKWDGSSYVDIGSADPVITGGHKDSANRRMISNKGMEDCCGVMWQWLRTPSARLDDHSTHLHTVIITHKGTPTGAAVSKDQGETNFNATLGSGADETVDTSSVKSTAPGGYYNLPSSKGSLYTYGANKHGNTQLLAGGSWHNGTYCGSRGRSADYYRWATSPSFGARFLASHRNN